MMDNRITARFFRVISTHDAAPKFEDALEAAIQSGNTPKARERDVGPNAIVRLERLSMDGSFLDGEIVRRQMINFPPEANDAGLVRLPLSEGGGIGHCVAFRYNIGLKVIAIQFDNRAVGRLLEYLKTGDATADYHAAPLVRKDAWDRYNRGAPRRFRLKIANPQLLHEVEGEVYDIKESSSRLSEMFRGPVITLEVSMGQAKKGSLAREKVSKLIRYFTSDAGTDADVQELRALNRWMEERRKSSISSRICSLCEIRR
jgi:hypothetical protein